MNHKRGKPKSQRSGCLWCKPWKHQASKKGRRTRTTADYNVRRQDVRANVNAKEQGAHRASPVMVTRKGFFGVLLGAVGAAFGSRFLSESVAAPLDSQPVRSIPSVWTSDTATTSTITTSNNDGATWIMWPDGNVSVSDNLARYES